MSLKKYRQFITESEEEVTYSFEELSDEAKKHAIENNYSINIDYGGWEDPIIEGFTEEMEALGLDDIEVEYTGFHSQGDGASFTAKVTDNDVFLEKALDIKSSTEFLDLGDDEDTSKEDDDLRQLMGDLRNVGFDNRERLESDNLYMEIVRNSNRYTHKNTISGDFEYDELDVEDDDRDWDKFLIDMEDMLTEWARDKSEDLYRRLEKYYTELTSDEAIEDSLRQNDYEFDKDGNIK